MTPAFSDRPYPSVQMNNEQAEGADNCLASQGGLPPPCFMLNVTIDLLGTSIVRCLRIGRAGKRCVYVCAAVLRQSRWKGRYVGP